MGCLFSYGNATDDDSYVYETEMPNFNHVLEPPVSRDKSKSKSKKSVMSLAYFQQFVKRDSGHDEAYNEILE
jgi:hypothetical protein